MCDSSVYSKVLDTHIINHVLCPYGDSALSSSQALLPSVLHCGMPLKLED